MKGKKREKLGYTIFSHCRRSEQIDSAELQTHSSKATFLSESQASKEEWKEQEKRQIRKSRETKRERNTQKVQQKREQRRLKVRNGISGQ